MKIKLSKIEDFYNGLSSLDDCVLPPKISFSIAYNRDKIENELRIYGQERDKIVLRHAVKDSDGNYKGKTLEDGQYSYDIKDPANYASDIYELNESEIDIDIRKVKFDDVEKAIENDKYTSLSVKQMNALTFMLE